MRNMTMEITEDNKLIIEIDLNQKGEKSGTGKTISIASSHGNKKFTTKGRVPREIHVGVNVFAYPPR